MTQEYWNWPESGWTSKEVNWKAAKKIAAGLDVGTTSTQAAVFVDDRLFGYANVHTGADFQGAAETALNTAFGDSGMRLNDMAAVIATGWGGRNVKYAAKVLDEVHCHARGARFMYGPEVHTVVDLGGQTCAAIRLYDWDRVRDFMMNDKCATGMGRNVEFLCDLLETPIEAVGEMSLDVPSDPEPVATSCYCFADTETLGLFGRPEYRSAPLCENEILAKHMFAIAWRILGIIGKIQPLDVGDVKIHDPGLGFTGGLAKNAGVTRRIERELDIKALTSAYDPMLAGAIGAALLGGR
jgi:benzoyl-CoA reductase subunit A